MCQSKLPLCVCVACAGIRSAGHSHPGLLGGLRTAPPPPLNRRPSHKSGPRRSSDGPLPENHHRATPELSAKAREETQGSRQVLVGGTKCIISLTVRHTLSNRPGPITRLSKNKLGSLPLDVQRRHTQSATREPPREASVNERRGHTEVVWISSGVVTRICASQGNIK